jgi:hypothetical protein
LSLETCRGGKINTLKKEKKCVKLVENPQLPQDARSTEYKKYFQLSCFLLHSWGKARVTAVIEGPIIPARMVGE